MSWTSSRSIFCCQKPGGACNNNSAPRQPQRSSAPLTFIAERWPDMLSRLYEQILADPRLLPSLKALLARLQVAVVHLARLDGSVLHRQNHATWRLLSRIAARSIAFERADDTPLQKFLKFMEAQAERLNKAFRPSELLFEQTLQAVDQCLSRQARQHSEGTGAALALLEREPLRLQWLPLQFNEQTETPDALVAVSTEMHGLHMGSWHHRFIPSDWLTAQITWVSDSGRYFHFVGQSAGEHHSLRRGATEQMLTQGLITKPDEVSVRQRAVDTLTQELDGGG